MIVKVTYAKYFLKQVRHYLRGQKITSHRNVAVDYALSTYGNYLFSYCSLWPGGQKFVLRAAVRAMGLWVRCLVGMEI